MIQINPTKPNIAIFRMVKQNEKNSNIAIIRTAQID